MERLFGTSPVQVPALAKGDAQALDSIQILSCFDAFGNDPGAHFLRACHGPAHQVYVAAAGGFHQAHIEFDNVKGDFPEQDCRGVAGAKIVDGDAHAHLSELVHDGR